MAVAAAAVTVCAGALASGGTAFASVAAGHSPAVNAGLPLPGHVFAPYFETYNGDSLSGLSKASGARFLTLAFLQTDTPGSCTVYWNGDTSNLPAAFELDGEWVGNLPATFSVQRQQLRVVVP